MTSVSLLSVCTSQEGREIEVGTLDWVAFALQQNVFTETTWLRLSIAEMIGAILFYLALTKGFLKYVFLNVVQP